MTKELIAEARAWAPCAMSPTGQLKLITRLADALEAATRVPVQGEPNDDREALARVLYIASDDFAFADRMAKAWDAPGAHGRQRWYRYADAVIAAGFSHATVPDAATEELETLRDIAETHAFCADRLSIETERADRVAREVCDRGCSYTGGPDEECSAHGLTPRDLWEQVEKVAAERDAALADALAARQPTEANVRADMSAWLLRGQQFEPSPMGKEYTDEDIASALTAPVPPSTLKGELAKIEAELAEWLTGKRSWCDEHHGKPDEIELTAKADAATIRLLIVKRDALRDAAPETEWEYQWGEPGGSFEGFDSFATEELARAEMELDSYYSSHRVMRRRKAGPWLPVEGESRGN